MTCLRTVAVLAVVALSACGEGAPQGARAQADAETTAACRQRAEQIYDRQNRAEIYSPNSSANAPFSANYTPDVSNRGLSDLYAHDKLVSDCVRNTGTGAERSLPATNPP